MRRPRPRSRRWAVPVAAAAAVVVVATLPGVLSSAGAEVPDLPTLTPAELLAKAQAADVETLSGTVVLTNNLGLPDLGAIGDGSSDALTALLAGSHEARVAVSGHDHLRVALPEPLAETNWIVSGDDVWSWDSDSQRVVHVSLSDRPDHADRPDPADHPDHPRPDADPAALAQRFLDAVTPTTEVSVRSPRYLAGRAVYELALDPRSDASTVGEVAVSVDAETGLPLDVRVTAAGATAPAFELGFTSVSFDAPPPETFEFTPPPGATVVEADDPAALASPGTQSYHRRHHATPDTETETETTPTTTPRPEVRVVGEAWDTVAIVTGATLPPALAKVLDGAPRVGTGATAGRLVSTKLVNVVLFDDGRIAAGAVTPDALVAAAA